MSSGSELPGQQLVEMVPGCLAPDAKSARVVRPACQPLLDLFTDADVFQLDLMTDLNALRDELLRFRTFVRSKVEIKNHSTGPRVDGQNQIGVHNPFVNVHHEIREDPPVISVLSRADPPNFRLVLIWIGGA